MEIEGILLNPERIPRHVAIIMDGNTRWAKKHHLPPYQGHRQGLSQLRGILEVCKELGIFVLTLFAFSTENWKRSEEEIQELFRLFQYFFDREMKNIQEKGIRVLHSGIRKPLNEKIQNLLDIMVRDTQNNDKGILNLAINYSGRIEILEAMKKLLLEKKQAQNLELSDIQERLFHPELPEPDLLIRTSGEMRISNFILWQLAYTELYFTQTLWPEFSKKDFILAISDYQKRERRFGGRFV